MVHEYVASTCNVIQRQPVLFVEHQHCNLELTELAAQFHEVGWVRFLAVLKEVEKLLPVISRPSDVELLLVLIEDVSVDLLVQVTHLQQSLAVVYLHIKGLAAEVLDLIERHVIGLVSRE